MNNGDLAKPPRDARSAESASGASAGWRQILALYGSCSPGLRLKFLIRWKHGNPFERLERLLPRSGRVVDVGCGAGFLANLIALRSPQRTVLGFDIDERHIARARSSVGDRQNIQFAVSDLTREPLPSCQVVVMVDALHHMTPAQQDAVLQNCCRALAAGGALYLLDVDVKPRWKYWYNYLVDSMTGLTGVTRGAALVYQSPAEVSQRLRAAGYGEVQVIPFARYDLAPRILYIASPPRAGGS